MASTETNRPVVSQVAAALVVAAPTGLVIHFEKKRAAFKVGVTIENLITLDVVSLATAGVDDGKVVPYISKQALVIQETDSCRR